MTPASMRVWVSNVRLSSSPSPPKRRIVLPRVWRAFFLSDGHFVELRRAADVGQRSQGAGAPDLDSRAAVPAPLEQQASHLAARKTPQTPAASTTGSL